MRHKSLSFSFRRFSKESWSWREIWVSPWNCAKFNLKLGNRSCRRMPHSHLTMKWFQIWQMNVLMIASGKHDCSSTCRRKFENDLKKIRSFTEADSWSGHWITWISSRLCPIWRKPFLAVFIHQLFQPVVNFLENGWNFWHAPVVVFTCFLTGRAWHLLLEKTAR